MVECGDELAESEWLMPPRNQPVTSDALATPMLMESCCAVLAAVLASLAWASVVSAKASEFMASELQRGETALQQAQEQNHPDGCPSSDQREQKNHRADQHGVDQEHRAMTQPRKNRLGDQFHPDGGGGLRHGQQARFPRGIAKPD